MGITAMPSAVHGQGPEQQIVGWVPAAGVDNFRRSYGQWRHILEGVDEEGDCRASR